MVSHVVLTCLNKNILQKERKGNKTKGKALISWKQDIAPKSREEMKLKITQANFHCANKANGQKDNLRMDSFSRWKVLRRRKLSFTIQPSTLPAQDFLLHVSRVIFCTSAGFDDPRVSLDTLAQPTSCIVFSHILSATYFRPSLISKNCPLFFYKSGQKKHNTENRNDASNLCLEYVPRTRYSFQISLTSMLSRNFSISAPPHDVNEDSCTV